MVGEIMALVGTGMVCFSSFGIVASLKARRSVLITECEEQSRLQIEQPKIQKYELVLGYDYSGAYKKPIIVNMEQMPHMLVCGLSRQGKTKMVENAIQGKRCVLINTDVKKDFKKIKAERINDIDKIQEKLIEINAMEDNDEPYFVVIDEILALIKGGNGKKIMDLITQLLASGSHKSIYVIAITQCAEKEVVNNKHLYNIRVCFKMLDESAYKVVLGKTPPDLYLDPRYFYYVTDGIYMGRTYDI